MILRGCPFSLLPTPQIPASPIGTRSSLAFPRRLRTARRESHPEQPDPLHHSTGLCLFRGDLASQEPGGSTCCCTFWAAAPFSACLREHGWRALGTEHRTCARLGATGQEQAEAVLSSPNPCSGPSPPARLQHRREVPKGRAGGIWRRAGVPPFHLGKPDAGVPPSYLPPSMSQRSVLSR